MISNRERCQMIPNEMSKLEKRVRKLERWEIERKARAVGRAEIWKATISLITAASIIATLVTLFLTGALHG